jgi:uncharacterized membrane protein
MEFFLIFIQIVAVFFIPVLIIKYHNFILTKWLGTIGTAYALGIMVAVIMFTLNKIGIEVSVNETVGQVGSHLAIAIAIPLLLFSANLKEARKLSRTVLKSFASLILSAVFVSSVVFYFYAKNIENGDVLSGMAIGLYTGGTPNLNAIGNIFLTDISTELKSTLISSANLSDMIIGAVFYVFLLILCKPLLSKFLRTRKNDVYITDAAIMKNTDELDLENFKLRPKLINRIILAFGLALLSAGLGLLVWILLGAVEGRMMDILVPSLLIGVTVFGIIGSFFDKIRETSGMNVVGQYFILVFSFALASSINFSQLHSIFGDSLILYGSITIGVFIVHVLLAKLLDIDVDCTMVTLTAGLYGPAFVPAITKQINNDDLTVPGLITGSIGYAIGTFLGMLLVFVYMI